MKAQLYTIQLQEPLAEVGQLVFAGNNSDLVIGIIVDHDDINLNATIMLFEPKSIKIYTKILKEVLTEEEVADYFRKCETKWPGYIQWFITMDPSDWRIRCPMLKEPDEIITRPL